MALYSKEPRYYSGEELEEPDPKPYPFKEEEEPKEEEEDQDYEDVDEEEEQIRIKNIKLQEENYKLQKKLEAKQYGVIENVNIEELLNLLIYHNLAGESFINIKHNGKKFLGLEKSDLNPIGNIVSGLLPKVIDGATSNSFKQG